MDQDVLANFLIAVVTGDAYTVKNALNYSERDRLISYYQRGLMLAASCGNIKIVKLILTVVSFNGSISGWNSLMYAIKNKHTDLSSILLDRMSIGKKNRDIWIDILINIANYKNKNLIDSLNEIDEIKMSYITLAVITALLNNNSSALSLFLNLYNFPIDQQLDTCGDNLLTYAARYGYIEMMEMLLKYAANIEYMNNDRETALILAAKHNKIYTLTRLLECNADINHKNKNQCTALMVAVKNGYEQAVKSLILNKANLEVPDQAGATAIMLAAKYGYDDIVKLLHESGANINHTDNHGYTILMYAVCSGCSKVVAYILKQQVKIDAVNKYGNTALMIAVGVGNIDIVKVLLDQKANIYSKNNNDENAVMIATTTINSPIYALLAPLYDYQFSVDTPEQLLEDGM